MLKRKLEQIFENAGDLDLLVNDVEDLCTGSLKILKIHLL